MRPEVLRVMSPDMSLQMKVGNLISCTDLRINSIQLLILNSKTMFRYLPVFNCIANKSCLNVVVVSLYHKNITSN